MRKVCRWRVGTPQKKVAGYLRCNLQQKCLSCSQFVATFLAFNGGSEPDGHGGDGGGGQVRGGIHALAHSGVRVRCRRGVQGLRGALLRVLVLPLQPPLRVLALLRALLEQGLLPGGQPPELVRLPIRARLRLVRVLLLRSWRILVSLLLSQWLTELRLREPLQCYLFSYAVSFICLTFGFEAVGCRFCLYKSKRRAKLFWPGVPLFFWLG